MYRTPFACIADIEVLTGASYRTAQRLMLAIRKHYNLSKRQKPTMDQVKSFLIENKKA